MRKTLERAIAALAITVLSAAGTPALAGGDKIAKSAPTSEQSNESLLVIPANARFPLTKRIGMGAGKSMIVQFPVALKDVLIADPTKMDAIVQSSNQVFLIGKTPGATNAFFFDQNGQQILTLEIAVGADMGGLESLLKRLLPGSNITLDSAGKSIVLTGTVRTPLDSARATDLAREFIRATKGLAGNSTATSTPAAGGAGPSVSVTTSTSSAGNGGGAGEFSAEKAIINLLSVEGEEQVQLRVHVAEVSRTLSKQFGINIGAQINAGNFSTSILTDNKLPISGGSIPIPGIGTAAVAAGQAATCATMGVLCNYNQGPQSSYGGSGVSTSANLGGGNRLTGALQALERDGLIRTLAEPNLTTVSGESAKFIAGGEFPVTSRDSLGVASTIFKEYGIGVSFTPFVLSEGRISLKIDTEVSELSDAGSVGGISGLTKRQAKSTVELPSGGSIAIAGLISDKARQNIDGYPGLKDVPILGTLFRSRDFVKEETELVIIVTPYLVRPTARQNLALPQDGLAEASDLRANFLGQLNRVYGKSAAQPVGDLKGDYGFIVE